MTNKKTSKTAAIFKLTLLSLFIAIMLVMNFTPIGYITTGTFSITLMTIPVALGAACLGRTGGTVLGFVFGMTSFLQAFNIGFMIDPMAAELFNQNPLAYTITCFIPRIAVGYISGLIFYLFERKNKITLPAFITSAASVPFFNTLLFMSFYAIMYKKTALGGQAVMTVIISAFTLNFLVELIVTLVAGAAINKTIFFYAKKYLNK